MGWGGVGDAVMIKQWPKEEIIIKYKTYKKCLNQKTNKQKRNIWNYAKEINKSNMPVKLGQIIKAS